MWLHDATYGHAAAVNAIGGTTAGESCVAGDLLGP